MARSNHEPAEEARYVSIVYRQAIDADLEVLPEIEVSAGQQFRDVGMPEVADDGPPDADFYREALDADRLWVAAEGGHVCAYGAATVLDGDAHFEQVSVHPDYAGRGIGGTIMATMDDWARARGFARATLLTFADVPWNAPYYARLGYQEIGVDRIGPELAAVAEAERGTDLSHWRRVCMEKRFRQ